MATKENLDDGVSIRGYDGVFGTISRGKMHQRWVFQGRRSLYASVMILLLSLLTLYTTAHLYTSHRQYHVYMLSVTFSGVFFL
jgi:hypothetical protein